MSEHTRRAILAWTAAALVVWIGLAWLWTEHVRGGSVASTEDRYAVAGGVLRDGGQGWRWYTDGHAAENVRDVDCVDGVLHAGFAAGSSVGFGAVTPDETLARAGITAGVSATRDTLRVFFFKGGATLSCEAAVFDKPYANAWVLWTVPL
jgi:hypothetical protein